MFTIFGADGYIGSAVVRQCHRLGIPCNPIKRQDHQTAIGNDDVIFCVGLTADFRRRSYDTIEAHVTLPAKLLKEGQFRSFLYLSSTRVYLGASSGKEDVELVVSPSSPDSLYNLTKLTAESLCLKHPNEAVRVARLSNVYGDGFESPDFLSEVTRSALNQARADFLTAPNSAKDYIHIADAVPLLIQIAQRGQQRTYNVASGERVTNQCIADLLVKHTNCRVTFPERGPVVDFSDISTERIASEFGFVARAFPIGFAAELESAKGTPSG